MLINQSSTWKVFFKDPTKCTPLQVQMATNLHNNILVPMLPLAGGSFTLVSGARDHDDILRLVTAGYNPSQTSDHLFGDPEPTAGAGDVIPVVGPEAFFAYVKAHTDRAHGTITLPDGKKVTVGQCIYEKNRTSWIHLSNPRRMFFPDAAGKTTLLQSFDNGRTYQEA